MKKLLAVIVALALGAPASAQTQLFPPTLNPNNVVGRLGIGPGPAEQIPFNILGTALVPFIPGIGGVTYPAAPLVVGNLLYANTTTSVAQAPIPFAPNLRPTNETSYSVTSASNSQIVIAQNDTAAVAWSLNATAPFSAVLKNAGKAPLTVTPSTGFIYAGTDKQQTLQLGLGEAALVVADGSGNYRTTIWPATGQSDAAINAIAVPSYSLLTNPVAITLSGTVTQNDIVGFNYNYTSGGAQVIQFRHTMGSGDTLQNACLDLQGQVRTNAALQALIGYDAISHAICIQAGATWQLFFNQTWPMVLPGNANPSTTAFTSGSATETVTVAQGNLQHEQTSELILGTSTLWAGRAPRGNSSPSTCTGTLGDYLGILIVTGDTATTPMQLRDGAPFYAQQAYSICDPTAGVTTGRVDFNTFLHVFNGTLSVPTPGTLAGFGTITPQAQLHVATNTTVAGGVNSPQILTTVANTFIGASEIDTFGAQSSYTGARADGTINSKTAVQSGEEIVNLLGYAYNGSAYQPTAKLAAFAGQNQSIGNTGSYISVLTTPLNSTGLVEGIRFEPSGGLTVGPVATDGGAGTGIFGSLVKVYNGTAIPTGGVQDVGYLFSSTLHFGTFFGSGAPTLAAAQGSLYYRSDGTAPYVNTNGTTGWAQLLSSASAIACSQLPALTGDVTTSAGSCATTLATVATAGTTGSSTAIPIITINAKGLTTAITTAAVVAPAGTLTGTTLAPGVTASSLISFGPSPTLVTPILGTPTSITLTNATGLPVSTGISGLGTGVSTALGINVGSAGAFMTDSSTNTLTNKTFDTAGAGNVLKINGTQVSSVTGTGSVAVLSTAPAFGGAITVGGGGSLTINSSTFGASSHATFELNSLMGGGAGTSIQFSMTNQASSYGMIFGFDGAGVATSGYHGANSGWFVNVQNGPIIFGTNNALAATLFASGCWGVGTTTDCGAGAVLANTTFYAPNIGSDAAATDTTLCWLNGSSPVGKFAKGSGTLGICLGTSSARFKHDVVDMDYGLMRLLYLHPVNFAYNDGVLPGGKTKQFGFTAEEFDRVFPELTHYDEAGKPMSVDLLGLVPVLTMAAKKLFLLWLLTTIGAIFYVVYNERRRRRERTT